MRALTRFFLAVGLVVGLWAGVVAPAAAEDVLKLAVPQRGAWDTAVGELGQRSGIFGRHGLKLEILYTSAGPESIQALIAGSVDIATASGAYAAFGTFAKGAPIRIIGSEVIGSPDLYWFVPAASPIRKVEDFNGKTVGFSLPGSSSHAGLLALIAERHLQVKAISTGSLAATITQTMTGQVDVGWSAVPYALDKAAEGEIRIIATGNDVASLRTRTGRVNLTNLATLNGRKDVLKRFLVAYKETVDWMYSSPDALKLYGEFAKLPSSAVDRVRGIIPREALVPDKIVGVDQLMAEAVQNKFLTKPLTKEQLDDLIRTGELQQ
jgi:ABC-type nitrate/sulfonate/bicarbonate transport system substrate-binding protein